VYDRKFDDKTLTFEASGALWQASLVMRDRETDSWWSIMTSKGIGGSLEDRDLVELPVSEKTQWKDWRERHPETLVLSVDGSEHVDKNPYDGYFDGDRTFRNLEVSDKRLPAKEPIFSFWLDGKPWAVPHSAFEGGQIFSGGALGNRRIMLYRSRGAAIFESTRAFLLEVGSTGSSYVDILPKADSLDESSLGSSRSSSARPMDPIPGFDTFWYNWVAVNEDTQLLR